MYILTYRHGNLNDAMRRLLLLLFFGLLAVTGGQAQVLNNGVKTLRSVSNTASSGGKIMRNIQHQSRRTEQAARGYAAANRVKLKPSGIRIVSVSNLDNDDQKRKNRGGSHVRHITSKFIHVKPLPKIKTLSEYEDERIAAKYDSIKVLVSKGIYVGWPYNLFKIADYAMRHDDEQFAIDCIEQVHVDRMTPKYLEIICRRYPALHVFMPEISRTVAVSAYCKMLDAKLKGIDCDSVRMQNGDTLLIVTDQFNPSLNPLVVLSCFYDPSKEVMRYKEAADSVIATYDQWSDAFKDTFARDFMATLFDNDEALAALDYFGKAPLNEFPCNQADFALDMATCAVAIQNDSLFTHYYGRAFKLDSVAAGNYWTQLYNGVEERYAANPSQTELADWLIENHNTPADYALYLSGLLIEQYWPDTEFSWEWEMIADDTPERSTIRKAILHILNKGESVDEGCGNSNSAPYISYLKAEMLMANPLMVPVALSLLDNVASTSNPDLRCRAILGQAYIAGHGLDHPKEALKILKKNIKQLDDTSVTAEVREMWYDYMAALYTNLGKTKDAEKYRKLKKTNE